MKKAAWSVLSQQASSHVRSHIHSRCLILPINTMSLVDFATGMSWFLISIEGICVMIGNIMVVTASRQC